MLNYSKQLLFAGAIFTIHNIEEAYGSFYFTYPAGLTLPFQLPTRESMIASIVASTTIGWLLIALAIWSRKEISKRNVLTILATVFVVNAIFPHIAGTIFLQRYFPAVITAIVLYLPYTSWLLPKLYHSYPTGKQFYKISISGLFATAIVVAGLQLVTYFLSQNTFSNISISKTKKH